MLSLLYQRTVQAGRLLAVVLIAAGAIPAWNATADTDNSPGPVVTQLEKRRNDLCVELARERARLLTQDRELRSLNEQINALYRKLHQLMKTRPSIKALERELNAVTSELDKLTGKEPNQEKNAGQ